MSSWYVKRITMYVLERHFLGLQSAVVGAVASWLVCGTLIVLSTLMVQSYYYYYYYYCSDYYGH